MINAFKNVFYITNRYIVLATPLILFSLISTIYMAYSARGNVLQLLFAQFLFFIMASVFVAGWFKMVKMAVIEPQSEDVNSLIKEFPTGVGEYFFPSVGAVIFVVIFSTLMLILFFLLGMKTIGDIGVSQTVFSNALKTTDSLKTFLSSLSPEQLAKLGMWNMLLLACMSLISFLSMFYMPALFFKTKNFFKAFFVGLRAIFSKKFFYTIGLFALIFIGYFVISILSTLFFKNMIMHFVMTLVNFYYIVLIAVSVFYFYYHNFVKSQVGQNVDEIV